MEAMRVWDYCEDYDGHLILKDENGKELLNTIKTNGEMWFDQYGYEIVRVESEIKKFGIVKLATLIVR